MILTASPIVAIRSASSSSIEVPNTSSHLMMMSTSRAELTFRSLRMLVSLVAFSSRAGSLTYPLRISINFCVIYASLI